MDFEGQPNDGLQFVPAGDGDAGKYLLAVNRKISLLAVLLNSVALLNLSYGAAAGAAEAVVALGWPNGGGPPEQLFQYVMVLLHLLLFTLSLLVSIFSSLQWAERQQVMLLCAAVILLVLTYAVASIPHPVAPALPAPM